MFDATASAKSAKVPKTGTKQPPVGYAKTEPLSWWDALIASYAGFRLDETIYSAATGKEHPAAAARDGRVAVPGTEGLPPWALWGAGGILIVILIVVVFKR